MAKNQALTMPFIYCENLVKIYKIAELEVFALQGLDLEADAGEFLAIVGASGSGKSTLMNIIGGLDRPSAGKVYVGGRDLLKLSDRALARYRRNNVGFVWQQSSRNLLPYLTAQENIELPMRISGGSSQKAKAYATELLDIVGLGDRRQHRLGQLSGGQQQRVAIAVALANQPQLLLADEPTGEVDSATAQVIWHTFRQLNARFGLTTVIVSHDARISREVDRVVSIRDGKVSTETIRQLAAERWSKVGTQAARAEDSAVAAGTAAPAATQEESSHDHVYEEQIVLDTAGRLQIPRHLLEERGIRSRAKIELVEEGILIRPPGGEKLLFNPEQGQGGRPGTMPQARDTLSLYGSIEQDRPPEANASPLKRVLGRLSRREKPQSE